MVAENLGEVLRGDRIMNSLYELKMGVEETCKILCRKELTATEVGEFSTRVEQDYRVHWVMDNLPSATKYVDETNPAKPLTIYDLGFPLGFRGSQDIPGTTAGESRSRGAAAKPDAKTRRRTRRQTRRLRWKLMAAARLG